MRKNVSWYRVYFFAMLTLWVNVGHAQSGSIKTELAADASGHVSTVSASLESFRDVPNNIFKLEGFSKDAGSAVSFLKSYYTLGSKGDREGLLALYEPKIRSQVSQQFDNAAAVKQVFEDLGEVKVESILSWGIYRVVLVTHQSKKNPGQRFPWVHTVACQPQCLFVREQALTQISSYIFYLARTGKTGLPSNNLVGEKLQKLTLLPIFSDEIPKFAGFFTNPLEMRLSAVEPRVEAQATMLLNNLLKLAEEPETANAKGAALFDEGLPSAYPRKPASSREVNQFAWDAYLNSLMRRTWKAALIFAADKDSIIVIAESGKSDLLFLPMHKSGTGWKLFTIPSKSAFWPLVESRSFVEALTPYLKP